MINKLAILIFKLFLYPWVYLRRRKKAPSQKEIKSLLLVNATGIGDTILSSPAWQVLRKKFPDATISLMVHERRRDVVTNSPFIDNIINYRKFVSLPRLIRKLRRLHIDIAIIFHGNDPDILPLVFLGGAKEIIGYKRRTRLPYFLTTALHQLPDHFIQAQMKLVEVVAGKAEVPPPVFSLKEEEREKAGVFLKEKGLAEKTLVGLLPGAGRPYKCWASERFAAVIAHLLQKFNTSVIIFGSRKEMALAREIENLSRRHSKKGDDGKVIIAAGSFNLREAGALMERLHLFITNDSGPLHLAMALGVPTVALFCPSNAAGLLPSGKNHIIRVIKKDIPCNPCITKRCRHPFCMEQISVEEVIKACEDLMKATSLPIGERVG